MIRKNIKNVPITSLQNVRLPPTETRAKPKSERNDVGVYPMSRTPIKKREIKSRYDNVIGSLTLFAPYSYENELEIEPTTIELERPITPIEEEVRDAPGSLHQLQRLVRRRIQPRAHIPCLTEEEQLELAAMIMGEVNAIWPDLREQIEYPFFTAEQNHELNRRITVHVITVCEEIFKQYLAKAELLKKKGVFSEEANMTRMKTQMALEARKFLNVLTVRRYISADMKLLSSQQNTTASDIFIYPDLDAPIAVQPATAQRVEEEAASKLSYKRLIALNRRLSEKSQHLTAEVSRMPKKGRKHRFKTVAEDLEDLDRNMPEIDTDKLIPLIHNLPRDLLSGSHLDATSTTPYAITSSGTGLATAHPSGADTSTGFRSQCVHVRGLGEDEEEDKDLRRLRWRTVSEPHLEDAGGLLDEMDIEIKDWFPCKEADERMMRFLETDPNVVKAEKSKSNFEIDGKVNLANLDRAQIARDLDRLLHRGEISSNGQKEETDDDDLPALIQAMPNISKEENYLSKLIEQIKELEEREKKFLEKENFKVREPTHPQPAVVDKRLGGQLLARTSDVRPSERQCITDVTLSLYGPVWNDLQDHIDPATVKHLDSNLFLGDAIREVYREIMKTVSKVHLEVINDPIVEDCPDELSLSNMLPSSSLHQRRRSQRVINPTLKPREQAPCGEQTLRQWAKPPLFSPGDKKGNINLEGVIENIMRTMANQASNMEAHSRSRLNMNLGFEMPRPATSRPHRKYVLTLEEFTHSLADAPKIVQERLIRSYASWLQWWRGSMNSEDYLKFVSTQETDFLAYLFHMYDSEMEDEDDEDDPDGRRSKEKSRQLQTRELEKHKERERKLKELREEKERFELGVWNVNSVLMGGLGQDPIIPEDEKDETKLKEPEKTSSRSTRKSFIKKRTQQPDSLQKSHSLLTDKSARTESSFHSELTSRSLQEHVHPSLPSPTSQSSPRAPRQFSCQERLERLWTVLKVPDHQRLDMAIRYSNSASASNDQLGKTLEAWERAAKAVLERESLMTQLESFERMASDPNRFFVRGMKGSSRVRMDEARVRGAFQKKIEAIDNTVRETVLRLEIDFQDTLTYQGRPYLDKMKWDRVEMLYWLQEERRRAVAMEAAVTGSPLLSSPSVITPGLISDR